MANVLDKTREYERQNLEAARIILSDPERHAKGCVLLVEWARRVLAKNGEDGKRDSGNVQEEKVQS